MPFKYALSLPCQPAGAAARRFHVTGGPSPGLGKVERLVLEHEKHGVNLVASIRSCGAASAKPIDLLDMVDRWKFKLHAKLKDMKPDERRAFWRKIHENAAGSGLHVAEPTPPPAKRGRRTG